MSDAQVWDEIRAIRQRLHALVNKMQIALFMKDRIEKLEESHEAMRKRIEEIPVLEEALKNLSINITAEAARTRATIKLVLSLATIALGLLTLAANIFFFLLSRPH